MSKYGVVSFNDSKVKQELLRELFKESLLTCPECGYDYTHLINVEEYKEKDGRKCIKLYFICEEGHKFIIDFQQHEGMTFLTTNKEN